MPYHFEHIAMYYWHRYMSFPIAGLRSRDGDKYAEYKDLSEPEQVYCPEGKTPEEECDCVLHQILRAK